MATTRPPLFEFMQFCMRALNNLTMGRVYRLLGISRERVTLFHAEAYLVSTTTLLITFIAAAHFWRPLGWSVLALGILRLLQIVSLNLSTLIFDVTPVGDSVALAERARWHFVAICFSIFDTILIFSFLYEFLDRRFGLLNQPLDGFYDYFFFATMTFFKSGVADIHPVTPLGKLIAMAEAGTGFFFLVFLISGSLGRLRRNGYGS